MQLQPMQTRTTPDRWVILKIGTPAHRDGKPFLRIVAGWSGSYLTGQSYRVSTPIVSLDGYDDTGIRVTSLSGSPYNLPYNRIGTNLIMSGYIENTRDSIATEPDPSIYTFEVLSDEDDIKQIVSDNLYQKDAK